MAAAGCRLIANPINRSAMFLGAVIHGVRYWYGVMRLIKKELLALKPAVVTPIDSSAINLRIAALAKSLGFPVCYYVAPQIWASRPWRIKKVKAAVDTLCCILPFEEAYFRERGVNAVYVGHPMFDQPINTDADDPALLEPPLLGAGLDNAEPRIAIFPGSRRAEIDNHMPPMLQVLSEIKGKFPKASFVAVAPAENRSWQIRHHLRHSNISVDIRTGNADAIIRWSDLVLAKSGTTTLQVARHHKPMVVIYALAWYKWHLFARFIINTPFIALVNILAGRELVPEYIPFYGSPLPVARECLDLLTHTQRRLTMIKDLENLTHPLQPLTDPTGTRLLAADRVAAEVAKYVK